VSDYDMLNGRPIVYGLDGRPIRIEQVAEIPDEARQLALTKAVSDRGEVTVSTVFTMWDQSIGVGAGAAVLWETKVAGGPLDDTTRAYTSGNAALAGHEQLVNQVVNGACAGCAKVLRVESQTAKHLPGTPFPAAEKPVTGG
jgi:hypothetical protein